MKELPSTEYFRPKSQTLLSDNWGVLTKHEFEMRRRDGTWQEQVREVYDRGNGATCLLHNSDGNTILLTRQFRLPVFGPDHDGYLIEAPAGLLEGASPESRMRAELEEETGYTVSELTHLFDVFMSPGSVSEYLACFIGQYSSAEKVNDGGGKEEEGEDIEVLHVPLPEAMEMILSGRIRDAKTIILIQHLALSLGGDDKRIAGK